MVALWADALRVATKGTLSLRCLGTHLADLRRHLCDTPRRRRKQLKQNAALLEKPP